jgi:hypothetical protein
MNNRIAMIRNSIATSMAILLCAIATHAQEKPIEKSSEKPVEVVVYSILASKTDAKIAANLKEFAVEVQRKDPALIGFVVGNYRRKSMSIGDTQQLELVDDLKVSVTVNINKDKNDRITLTVSPPGMGSVTYECACGKYLPIMTDHETKKGERLFVAISAKPCTMNAVPKKDK